MNYFIAFLCLMMSTALFAASPVAPKYKADFDAPRVNYMVTEQVCEDVGLTALGVSKAISDGRSNKEIQLLLVDAFRANLQDSVGLAAGTIMLGLIDNVRTWPKQVDYQRIARDNPDLNSLELHRALGAMRCKEHLMGKTIKVVKVVRVN